MKPRVLLVLLAALLAGAASSAARAEGLLDRAAQEFVNHLRMHGALEAQALLRKIVRCWKRPQTCDKSVDADDVERYGQFTPKQQEIVRRAFSGGPPIAPDQPLTVR